MEAANAVPSHLVVDGRGYDSEVLTDELATSAV